MADKSKETIIEGLGISQEWDTLNNIELVAKLENSDTVSQVFVNHASDIKADMFGSDVANEISEYEKKLIWSGFEIAKILLQRKPDSPFGAFIGMLIDTPKRDGKADE